MSHPLDRSFYQSNAVAVARALLGKKLVHIDAAAGTISGVIVETEAYAGREDAACHSYKRKSPQAGHRTNVMFGPGGYAYVYLIYGMYDCFNVVANAEGEPEAVLIRAVEPREGVDTMRRRRGAADVKKLCGGPGRLCMALDITRRHYGADLCATDGGDALFITEGETVPDSRVLATPRINVNYAGEAALYPYRFVIKDSLCLSVRRGGLSLVTQ
ncbi:MAG: DNA-3-methyladenine glycosylase [Synergistaceae bacterium]|nr:DNA-3-methyladenine glycosylase [Synergistaceae bacterium]